MWSAGCSCRPAIAIAEKETSAPDIQSAARVTGEADFGDIEVKSRLDVGWG
jgi:hypothetical protein